MKIFIKSLFVAISLAFIGGLFLFGIILYISYDLPQINSLSDYSPPIGSKILSKDGEVLLELSKEDRQVVPIEEIPQNIIDTFLAAEDDNFYNHSGIDYLGITRAMLKNIKEGRIKQGASTITQQVAKSLLLSNERTFTRKIKDMLLATKIEEKLSKNEILFLYLNQVYLGGGYYGVKSAFKGYFDKELEEATIAETALVAGLLVAPGRYSPYINPAWAKSRQTYVLGRLRAGNKISEEEYQAALQEDIKIQIRKPNPLKAGYFTDWIRQKLTEHFGKEDFLTNGYEVVTTLDWELQQKAEQEVIEGVRALDKRQGYKGPLRTLVGEEEIFNFIKAQREEVYKNASNFIIFKADGTSEQEFQFTEDELKKLVESRKEALDETKVRGKHFVEIGIDKESEFLKFLDFSKPVEAVVTKVSNQQRMIYANYAGIKVMIPEENFSWAHERQLSEDVKYWGLNYYPENIVKPGDVILVKISDKIAKPTKYLYSKFKTDYKANEELFKTIDEQEFFVASLDQEPEAQGALLSISPFTGEIKAMVGGYDFNKSQFNRVVQSNRQPGSAFKPVIYAVGLENDYTPASTLLDSPQALGGVDDASLSWKPRNYDGKFMGTMTFRRALESSRNIPTIKLSQDIGVEKIINFVDRLGIKADLPSDLSVSLGSFGMNLMDLVQMYSIFPNGGRKVSIESIISIKDRYGKVHHLKAGKAGEEVAEMEDIIKGEITEDQETPIAPIPEPTNEEKAQNPYLVNLNETQVYDERLAYIMNNILRGVIQRGTGQGTKGISSFIGGKTGTTNNYVDAWFIGFSSKLVTGVWTGFDDNKTLGWPETGAKAALPIWREFMNLAIRKYGDSDFPIPSGIVNIAIDPDTGKLASEYSTRFVESFVEGTGPGEEEISGDPNEDSDGSILDSDDYYSAQ